MSTQFKTANEVPTSVIAARLEELSDCILKRDKDAMDREFTIRIPAELDRDPDLVLSIAASRLMNFENTRMEWIKCSDRLPKIEPRRRKNKNGILVMYSDGDIVHFKEVTPALYASMENGPRMPLKYEAPTTPQIIQWMALPSTVREANGE